MQEGLTLFDFIFMIMLAVFVISRFMGQNLPKDKTPRKRRSNNVFQLSEAQKESMQQKAQKQPKKQPKTFENLKGIDQVKAADPSFNEEEFKNGAAFAFKTYYEAIDSGDEDTLESLLAPRLLDDIGSRIDELEEKSQKMRANVGKIESIDIVDARMSGKTAIIDVKYTAEIAEYVSDEAGKVKSGRKTPSKNVVIWTWARPIDSDDPNWELEEISKPS